MEWHLIEKGVSEFEELILGDFADEAINRYGDVLKDILNIDFRNNCRLNHLPKEASIRFAGIMPGNFENLKINKKILNRADKIYLAGKELQVGNNRLSKEMSDPESGNTDIESHIKMAMKKYGYENAFLQDLQPLKSYYPTIIKEADKGNDEVLMFLTRYKNKKDIARINKFLKRDLKKNGEMSGTL